MCKEMKNTLIGSHNSLSYNRPRQWWLRPFNFVAKCQNLILEEQWNAGVRYFDIRVRFRNDKIISGHGLVDYEVDVWDHLLFLDKLAESVNQECIVRVMLEEKGTEYDTKFKAHVSCWRNFFTHIRFVGGLRKEPFEVIAEVENVPERHCYQLLQDYSAKTWWDKIKGIKFPYPRYWAKKNNHEYRCNASDVVYTILDFVEK